MSCPLACPSFPFSNQSFTFSVGFVCCIKQERLQLREQPIEVNLVFGQSGQYVLDGECWLPNNQTFQEWEMNEDYF